MKSIVWYNAQSGNIVGGSTVSDDTDVQAMLPFFPGCGYVYGDGSAETHWVSGGELVQYTQQQAMDKTTVQAHDCEWSNASMSWVDTRTLAQAKEARLAVMKAARDATWDGTFDWNGHSFDCHLVARTNIIGRAVEAQIAPQGWTTSWILADNTELTGITAADMLAIGAALGQHMDAAKARYTARKAAIEAATTVAEVEAVEW